MNVWRVICLQSIPSIGQFYENAVHFSDDSGSMTANAVGIELDSFFCNYIRQFQSDFLGWQQLYIYNALNPLVPVYIYDMANQGGFYHGGYIYPTTCMKLKWQSTIGGRHGRGRFFIAGGRVDWVTPGGVNSAGSLNGGIWLNTLLNRYDIAGSGPLKLGLMRSGSHSVGDYTKVIGGQLWQYLGQQRRRNYGVGI